MNKHTAHVTLVSAHLSGHQGWYPWIYGTVTNGIL